MNKRKKIYSVFSFLLAGTLCLSMAACGGTPTPAEDETTSSAPLSGALPVKALQPKHVDENPGSHVVVKTEGKELPDRTFEEAGRLAAYSSKGREQEKVEIDYVQKKQVKKPAGAKPGFVVYYTNYSLMIDSDISGIEKLSD